MIDWQIRQTSEIGGVGGGLRNSKYLGSTWLKSSAHLMNDGH